MKEHYIQAPLECHEITLIKCKAKRNKPAKREDVPIAYRKDPMSKLNNWLYKAEQDIKFFIRRFKHDY